MFLRSRRDSLQNLMAIMLGAFMFSGTVPRSDLQSFLSDPGFRHTRMVQALVNPLNHYSQRRLAHYATSDPQDWDRLPAWNPVATAVTVALRAQMERAATTEREAILDAAFSADAHAIEISAAARDGDMNALRTLGEQAFFQYPAQFAEYTRVALASATSSQHFGLWSDPVRGVGGLVRVRLPDGHAELALTCASCHASVLTDAHAGGVALVAGRANQNIDVGAMLVAQARMDVVDAVSASVLLSWGPGRLDVTSPEGTHITRIPDLRPVRWLTYLHHDATVTHRDTVDLAMRIDTLITTAYGTSVRPPREVALGLAVYLESLGETLPAVEPRTQLAREGREVFVQHCAACHDGEGLTGMPVALETVGTDPVEGQSPDRGTGAYRVPSLRGVSSRGMLLHDGSARDLSALLSPVRTGGHRWGADLDAVSRARLEAWLGQL